MHDYTCYSCYQAQLLLEKTLTTFSFKAHKEAITLFCNPQYLYSSKKKNQNKPKKTKKEKNIDLQWLKIKSRTRIGEEFHSHFFFLPFYRFANVTKIPSFGLVTISEHVWSSSTVCVESITKLRKIYDRTIFTSRRANRWPEKKKNILIIIIVIIIIIIVMTE